VACGANLGYVALMERLRKRLGRQELVDGALAGGVAAFGAVEVWLSNAVHGSRLLMTALLLAAGLVLLARRRQPLVALALVGCTMVVGAAAWDLVDQLTAPFAAMLVAVYSVAAFGSRRAAIGGTGVLVATLSSLSIVSGDRVPLTDTIWVGSVLGGVWAAGRLVNAHRKTAEAMADHAALVEREREERARAAVAEERSRIARELHDVVAHSVSVMVVQAGAERRALGDDRGETREVLQTIEQTGRQTLAEMRRLLGMLRRSDDELALAPQPSIEHVDMLVSQVREAGLPVTLDIEGDPVPLAAGIDLSAYRIVQEALTNALKHAGPASARVTVRYGRSDLELEIVDDGVGAAANGDGAGHGLIGMRERVHLFGGKLATGAGGDGGYAVRARLPLDR
jgi:signal transduction histidine kinase